MAEPVQGISAVPDEGNARYFHVVVAGPKDVCHMFKCYVQFESVDFRIWEQIHVYIYIYTSSTKIQGGLGQN